MINNYNLLLELLDSLEIVLNQYSSLTNLISIADMEEIDEINDYLTERETLIIEIKIIEPQIIELINAQAAENAALIVKMFSGDAITSILNNEQKLLQQRVINIRSLQNDILIMDENNEKRLKNKYDEIKITLTNLNNDKKKINFYENSRFSFKGDKYNKLN